VPQNLTGTVRVVAEFELGDIPITCKPVDVRL
jgi:hypothetical protein